MKKLTSIAFTLSASALLFITASCNSSSTTDPKPEGNTQQTSNVDVITPTEGSTVYVRMDSLLNQYDMYLDLKAELEEKVKKAEADLATKGRAFERDVTDFQDKVNKGLLTRSESQTKADELARREQQLREQQQRVSMELEDSQFVMLNKISQSIDAYVLVYNQEKKYSLIINTTGNSAINSSVLWGNPGLDITNDLVKGLNAAYAKAEKETPKEQTTQE